MAIPGSIVAAGKLVTPGGAQGPLGGQGPPGPTVVSADAGNQATLGSDSKIYVPDPTPQITSVRLRSWNSVGNPNFEVDQRNAGVVLTNVANATFLQDRYSFNKTGTMVVNGGQNTGFVLLPGTNFTISRCFQRITLTTQQASLGASDYLMFTQWVEGPSFRELINDVHSISLLVRSSVANLNFGLVIGDAAPASKALTKLCNIPSANTWTLLTFPNIPVFPAGNFSTGPGLSNQFIRIGLAAGSSVTSTANDVWGPTYSAALGQDNFASKPVNSTFDIAFIQWEPGPLCTTLQDKSFSQNLDECLRMYQKSAAYGTLPVQGGQALLGNLVLGSTGIRTCIRFPKRMAKAPSMQTCGLTAATNAVYLDANAAAALVQTYSVNDSEVINITLTSAGPATGPISVLGGWAADTGW